MFWKRLRHLYVTGTNVNDYDGQMTALYTRQIETHEDVESKLS